MDTITIKGLAILVYHIDQQTMERLVKTNKNREKTNKETMNKPSSP